MASKRIAFFDNLKFVLIVFVVIGHFLLDFCGHSTITTSFWRWIYLFHMPAFLFVSGMFAKSIYSAEKGLRINTLAFYLLMAYTLYTGIWALRTFMGKDMAYTPWAFTQIPWYFVTMATLGASLAVVAKLRGGAKIVVPLAILFALIAPLHKSFGDFLIIGRSISFAPFFFAGYFIDTVSFASMVERAQKMRWPIIVSIVFLFAVFLAIQFGPKDFWSVMLRVATGRRSYAATGDWPSQTEMLLRLIHYALATGMIAAIALLIPLVQSKMTDLGSRTLQVYFFHPFIYFPFRDSGLQESLLSYLPYVALPVTAVAILVAIVLAWPQWPEQMFRKIQRSINIDNNP